MPLSNPVPAFNFNVFMMDAKPASSLGLTDLLGAGVAVAKSALFGSFSEVSGLNAEMETEEYREGGKNHAPQKFVKWGRYPNLIFKRGVTLNADIWDWYYAALYKPDDPVRKNGLIVLNDRGLSVGDVNAPSLGVPALGLPALDRLPVGVWFFRNALPEKLQGPALNAKSNEIAIETLEVVHEGLYRIGPGTIPGAVGAAARTVGL